MPPTAFTPFRHRNYQLYFIGQLISNAGTWMQIIAQGWLVFQISHSKTTLGIVGFASAIPALLITPWGGVIVDRVPKRILMMITQATAMLLAFILGGLALADVVQVWHVVVLAAMLGVVNAFDAPARQAFIVDMVGKSDLPNAIAINSMMFNSARAIGPALGGMLLALVGAAYCFMLNGLSFLAVIIGLGLMQLPRHEPRPYSGSIFQQLTSGVRYAFQHRDLAGLLLLALVFSFFGVSYSTLLPAFVEQVLHQGALAYGWITTAIGVGAVCGAFIIAQFGAQGNRGRWLNLANIFFPLVLAAFAYVPTFQLSLGLAFCLGVGFMVQFTSINTLLQTNVEDQFRGRLMGLYTLTFFGFAPFGNLLIGVLADRIGLSQTVLIFAGAGLCFSRLVFLIVPGIRKLS